MTPVYSAFRILGFLGLLLSIVSVIMHRGVDWMLIAGFLLMFSWIVYSIIHRWRNGEKTVAIIQLVVFLIALLLWLQKIL
jgi:hypothetical protein